MAGPSKIWTSAPRSAAASKAIRTDRSDEEPGRVVPPMPTMNGFLDLAMTVAHSEIRELSRYTKKAAM